MSELGICINANGAVPDAPECAALGLTRGSWVRTPIQGPLSLLDGALERLPGEVSLMVALNSECQEVGHDFGLEQQFTNAGSCMEYAGQNDPAYVSPDSHDDGELLTIYSHSDGSAAAGRGEIVAGGVVMIFWKD